MMTNLIGIDKEGCDFASNMTGWFISQYSRKPPHKTSSSDRRLFH
jgi:hypothetical protein